MICALVASLLPVQKTKAASKPENKVQNSAGTVYLPSDLCGYIMSAGVGLECGTYGGGGNNVAYVFTDKTKVTAKGDSVWVYGVDVIEKNKKYEVNAYSIVTYEWGSSTYTISFDKLKGKKGMLELSSGSYLGNVYDRSGKKLKKRGDFKSNGTEYVMDLYIVVAVGSDGSWTCDYFVPKNSKAMKYDKKKKNSNYQKIKVSKKAVNKSVNTTNKAVTFNLGAKAKGKVSYTVLGEIQNDDTTRSAWYLAPNSTKDITVTKSGQDTIKQGVKGKFGVLIKAAAKGKNSTTYRVVEFSAY